MDLESRPLTWADLSAVCALQNAYDRRFFGEPLLAVEDVRADWRNPEFALTQDSEAWVSADGDLVGFATLDHRGGLESAVSDDPTVSWLADVLETRWEGEAARRGLACLHRYVAAADALGIERLSRRGYHQQYTIWTLTLPRQAGVRSRELPSGYRLVPFAEADARDAYAVIADAFAEWGGHERSYGAWRAAVLDRPDVSLPHCLLARFGEEVVGVCLVVDPVVDRRPELWVAQLAVRADHRRCGVAQEMLAQTVVAARARGVVEVGLATDTRTGARGLYERLGMTVRHTLHAYALALGPVEGCSTGFATPTTSE